MDSTNRRHLDWVPIGPRFSNAVLQALTVLIARRPPAVSFRYQPLATISKFSQFTFQGHRLLVLTTTSLLPMLSEMQMTEIFDSEIRVPPISSLDSVERVIGEVELFRSSNDRQRGMQMLEEAGFGVEGKLNVGVKKLLSVIEMARQADDPAEKLTSALLALS